MRSKLLNGATFPLNRASDAEARSKPYVAKPIDSASDGTSIRSIALLKALEIITSEKDENDFETACLGVFATSGSPLALAVPRFNCGSC